MAKNNIGGYFVELALLPDMPSFDTGNKLIDGLTTRYNNLIGVMRNAAVVGAGVANQESKTAQQIGTSTLALNTWSAAAKIAGVNSQGLISSMGKLGTVLNHLDIDGRGLSQYSEQLGKLGLGIDDFKDENGNFLKTDKAYAQIIRTAQEKAKANPEDAEKISYIVGDILGGEGQNFYNELQRLGMSIDSFVNLAQSTVFQSDESIEKGLNANKEINTLKTLVEEMGKRFGQEIAGELTDPLKEFNQWFVDNKEDIIKAIQNISEGVGRIADKVAPMVGDVGAIIVGALAGDKNKVLEGADNLGYDIASAATGVPAEEIKSRNEKALELNGRLYQLYQAKNKGKIIKHKLTWDEAPEDLQKEILELKKRFPGWDPSNIIELNDGIIRPDGTVTQVAPDDWVFAARNLGDMARAFIPQNYATAGNTAEYTINQTFNISGSKDIPQVLKQQAYHGVQEGLMDIMAQSSQRLQMMSGTR